MVSARTAGSVAVVAVVALVTMFTTHKAPLTGSEIWVVAGELVRVAVGGAALRMVVTADTAVAEVVLTLAMAESAATMVVAPVVTAARLPVPVTGGLGLSGSAAAGGGGFGGGDGGNGTSPEARATPSEGNPGLAGDSATHILVDDLVGTVFESFKRMVENGGLDGLPGGNGNDTLDGGPGSDDLFGLGGSNTFQFEVTDSGGDHDTIHDFLAGISNKLALQFSGVTFDTSSIQQFLQSQTADLDDRTFSAGCSGELIITVRNLGRDLVIGDFNIGDANCGPDLSVTKDNGLNVADFGDPLSYTIEVVNNGPGDAVGATVTDVISADLEGASWTCAPSGGATCSAAGDGNILDTVNIPEGDGLIYTLNATISQSVEVVIINTVEIAPAVNTIDPNQFNNTATDLTLRQFIFGSGFED